MSRARERGWCRAVTTIFCALVLVVSTAGRSRAQAQPSSPKLVLHVGHASEITALEFARSKRQIAAGSAEGVVKLWDVGSGLEMQSFQAHKGTVRGLRMFPGDRRL